MAPTRRRSPWLIVAVPLALVALASLGVYVYIHFIQGDPPARLDFAATSSGASASAPSAGAPASFDGTWSVASGSEVGYRVKEVLFGQSTEAVGRTSGVTGSMALQGTEVTAASIVADMTTVKSDEDRRDNQFRSRIMETARFPTATFELASPIALPSIPDDQVETTVDAQGRLTVHGTTKDVTVQLAARRNGARIEVKATIPVRFSDYGIPQPSNQVATVQDDGEIEVLVSFAKG